MFDPSDDIMRLCGCVELIDDLTPEETETFFIRLNTTDSGVDFRVQTSTVTIFDDGNCTYNHIQAFDTH